MLSVIGPMSSYTRHCVPPYQVQCRAHIDASFYNVLCPPTPQWRNSSQWASASSLSSFTITLRHTKVGRTPLDEWSARCRDLHLTTQHKRQHPCPRWDSDPQTHVVDRATTGIGQCLMLFSLIFCHLVAAVLTLGIRNFLEDW